MSSKRRTKLPPRKPPPDDEDPNEDLDDEEVAEQIFPTGITPVESQILHHPDLFYEPKPEPWVGKPRVPRLPDPYDREVLDDTRVYGVKVDREQEYEWTTTEYETLFGDIPIDFKPHEPAYEWNKNYNKDPLMYEPFQPHDEELQEIREGLGEMGLTLEDFGWERGTENPDEKKIRLIWEHYEKNYKPKGKVYLPSAVRDYVMKPKPYNPQLYHQKIKDNPECFTKITDLFKCNMRTAAEFSNNITEMKKRCGALSLEVSLCSAYSAEICRKKAHVIPTQCNDLSTPKGRSICTEAIRTLHRCLARKGVEYHKIEPVTQESLEKERRKLQRAQKREDIPARTPVPSTNKQKSSDSPIREKKHPQPPDSKVQYVENLDEDE